MSDQSWGILRCDNSLEGIRRTLEGLRSAGATVSGVRCGSPTDVVEIDSVPVTHDTSIPEGYVWFGTDRKTFLEEVDV